MFERHEFGDRAVVVCLDFGLADFAESVAEASFDAWIKYYRSDENTPNATISYYTKGSLVALALDLSLRGGARGSGVSWWRRSSAMRGRTRRRSGSGARGGWCWPTRC